MQIVSCDMTNSSFAFWKFLEFFFSLNILALLLVDLDTEANSVIKFL